MGSLWNRSGMVERDSNDLPADGALAYFYIGGTTTPLSVYSDAGQASPHTHPVVADARGRWPDVFVPYVLSFDVQVKNKYGVQLTYSILIPNPDPIDLTVTIPAEEKVQTGMMHGEFVDATKSGYVRLNGRTMGNAASTATERANDDTEDLFTYLWNNMTDALAPVSTGRGVSAAADFAANKTITLPDLRGRALVGLDTMGNSAASAFTGLTFTTGSAILVGSTIGGNSITLSVAQLPAHTFTGTTDSSGAHSHSGTTNVDGLHGHTVDVETGGQDENDVLMGGMNVDSNYNIPTTGSAHSHAFTTGSAGAHTHTFTTNSVGSGAAIPVIPRSMLVTWFIKL